MQTKAGDAVPVETQLQLLRQMTRIRYFEEKVAELLEADEITTPCHLYIGQEAIAAGVCAALLKQDTIWGGHRSHGHYLAKGGDLRKMMAEILCRATGCSRGRGGSMHLFARDVGVLGTVPLVAATIPLAVGAALSYKLNRKPQVAVSFFGDGATEEGHFHESLNMAALYTLPVVFVCENNFYSSHMHLLERRPADNLETMAAPYNVPASRLDGNDVTAVFHAACEAVDRARGGAGPTLLACDTFRWRGHVGASWDEDVGVKRGSELKQWLPKDPLKRLRKNLAAAGVPEQQLQGIEEDVQTEVEEAVAFARESPYPAAEEVLQHVFCGKEPS